MVAKVTYILLIATSCSAQIDTMEFQKGYPNGNSALQQLKDYPSPRYFPNTRFYRNYNWIDPCYAGGQGQYGISAPQAIKNATDIQEELALNWNYFIVIPNSGIAANESAYKNVNNPLKSFVSLANKYPKISLGVTTFWTQMKPSNVLLAKDFTAPDSLFTKDGITQNLYIQCINKYLTRPITLINENGEEPPYIFPGDKIPQSIKKKYYRELYTSKFVPKGTCFSIYQNEGGPIDRLDWNTCKSISSKINGNYYSTSDYYPQYARNWKISQGPWHGWNWIDSGRKVEIKAGDKLFSPYVAAGWSYNPESDIRPAQWLGLLKCMTVVGAEFFYVGYFNLKQPFSKPENYIWQNAIPSYAQAIATRFSGILRTGNVLFDAKGIPIVTSSCNDKDVLVTVRKGINNRYIIAAASESVSNTIHVNDKNVIIMLDGKYLKIIARRQGSVYVYDKSVVPPIFYQLDSWHEASHPDRWSKDWNNEAEVFDSSSFRGNYLIKSEYKKGDTLDFTDAKSYIVLNNGQWVNYTLYNRDLGHLKANKYIYLLVKCNTAFKMMVGDVLVSNSKLPDWTWLKYPFSIIPYEQITTLQIKALNNYIYIDKIKITDK